MVRAVVSTVSAFATVSLSDLQLVRLVPAEITSSTLDLYTRQ